MVVMAVIIRPSEFLPPVAGMTVLVDFLPRVGAGWSHEEGRGRRPGRSASRSGWARMCEVWGEPYHPEDDNPVFDFVVATPSPGRVSRRDGLRPARRPLGSTDAADADLVCLVPKRGYREPSPGGGRAACARRTTAGRDGLRPLLGGLHARRGRAARRPALHHALAPRRRAGRRAIPEAIVDGNVLYVQDGSIVTGAGSAAGLDAALHLMRQQFGARVAATTARRMVVPPHRDGGQAQFIARPVPVCESEALAPLLAWIAANLGEELDVETLARQMHMSARTFARRFKEETGTTPYSWILGQRVRAAEELLEQTDHSDRLDRRRGRLRQRRDAAPPLRALARRQPAGVPPYVPVTA